MKPFSCDFLWIKKVLFDIPFIITDGIYLWPTLNHNAAFSYITLHYVNFWHNVNLNAKIKSQENFITDEFLSEAGN